MRTLVQLTNGGVEQPMIPTHPPTTKRKVLDDENPLSKPAKKHKDEASAKSNALKRKLQGEEQIGGLRITRGPPRPSSALEQHSNPIPQPPRPASVQPEQLPTAGPSRSTRQAAPSKPPSSRAKHKGKEHDDHPTEANDGDVEEDVRRMDTEADDLRDRARSHAASLPPGALKTGFKFPAEPASAHKLRARQLQSGDSSRVSNGYPSSTGTPQSRSTGRDTMQPIAEQETPQIAKNKFMRGEHPSMKAPTTGTSLAPEPDRPSASGSNNLGHTRRRSSISMRGKRVSASFENPSVISKPHTSVADSSLYKHIDAELPDSERMRQLLYWASARALPDTPGSSTSPPRRKPAAPSVQPDPNLPALPPGGLELLRSAGEEIIQQLAEKLIDTSVHSGPGGSFHSGPTKKMKENRQNVRNRTREVLFLDQIKQREAESVAWAEVSKFYSAHQSNVLASFDKRTSAKAKGKQRALSLEPEDIEPMEDDLDERFRGMNGFAIAKRLISESSSSVGKGDARAQDLPYKEDCLHTTVSSAHQLARIASADLDHRFSILSLSLAQRSHPPAQSHTSNPSALSNYLPMHPTQATPTADPQDLLRALSRVDAVRPKEKVGDAARRAAKDVQRVQHDGGEGIGPERKLTGVPAPTPRKPPGTPRRATTPGASRRG